MRIRTTTAVLLSAVALALAATGGQGAAGRAKGPTPKPPAGTAATTKPRYDLVIKISASETDVETETRVLRKTVAGKWLIFECQPVLYRLEMGPVGVVGARPVLHQRTSPLTWAPGAEHVYLRESDSASPCGSFEKSRILPDRSLVLVSDTCRVIDSGLLPTWEMNSDPSYPLTFKVVKGLGYVYMCGKGTVKSPGGHIQNLGEADTPEKWIPSLSSSDLLIREAAAQALGWLGGMKGVPALIKALKDPSPMVRRSACEALGKIGDRNALPALQTASQDSHTWTSETASGR